MIRPGSLLRMAGKVGILRWGERSMMGWMGIKRGERGATLVEAAIVYGILFLTIFAVLEFGLAFKDWLSVSHASREGARAGATFGNDPDADMRILRDVEATLAPVAITDGMIVTIFKAPKKVGPSTPYTYTPGSDCSDLSPGGILAGTCCDWKPCPDPFRATYDPPEWDPATRDIEAPQTDRIGVEVQFTHEWITGLFGSTSDFTTATDFQIEPQVFGS